MKKRFFKSLFSFLALLLFLIFLVYLSEVNFYKYNPSIDHFVAEAEKYRP